jgi:PAS domain S-box-containing protein
MAKWLGIPTVAEGVEQVEQVEFLHSIGCEYVQGYYFARPMPVDKYEELINDGAAYKELAERSDDEGRLSLLPQIEVSFDNLSQAVAIYEVVDDNIEYIRVNKAFYKMFEEEVSDIFSRSPIDVVYEDFREPFKKAFSDVIKTRDNSTCEYLRYCRNTSDKWIYLKLKYICRVGNRDVILGNYFDITAQKRIEFELQNYRMALSQSLPELNHVLIVEDDVLNREILKDMFDENYEIFEASSGLEAIDILDKNPCKIDLILLDLFMPHMSGVEFLEYKKSKNSICDIPVIIITSDDTTEQQIRTLSLGANDYITKPFVREVVMRRVNNVLELQQSFKKSVKESRLFK